MKVSIQKRIMASCSIWSKFNQVKFNRDKRKVLYLGKKINKPKTQNFMIMREAWLDNSCSEEDGDGWGGRS